MLCAFSKSADRLAGRQQLAAHPLKEGKTQFHLGAFLALCWPLAERY